MRRFHMRSFPLDVSDLHLLAKLQRHHSETGLAEVLGTTTTTMNRLVTLGAREHIRDRVAEKIRELAAVVP